jgi:hypothetical protein
VIGLPAGNTKAELLALLNVTGYLHFVHLVFNKQQVRKVMGYAKNKHLDFQRNRNFNHTSEFVHSDRE